MDRMIIYIAPLVAVIGLVLYFAVKSNAEVKEVGRIMFFCGLLVFLMMLSGGKAIHLP